MHDAHEFLRSLAVVLGVAAVTTVLFQKLRQPVVLGYLIAGLIIGPHVPIPLVADPTIVRTLSELGVILLMFSLGLEFSLGKLVRVGPTAGVTALIQCSLMIWLGFQTGRLFGWTTTECVFAGAIISISSTTIIAKAFDEQRVTGRLRDVVVGVLIVEDLIAILLMAALTTVATGHGLSATEVAVTMGRLAAFLVALVVAGLLVVPRTIRAVVRLDRPETTLVASIGLCFAIALLAQEFGYSVALGAFLAGSLVAESGEEKRIEKLVEPVRDVFGAVFFVSVGMLLDPALVGRHWGAIAAFTAVVLAGKIASVAFGAFLTGSGTRLSVQAGLSLAQIGEFSFIIAGLGLTLGATRDFLYPVAVAVSAVTTLLTPWLIRASGPVANFVDRKSPKPVQTFASLYGSWVESLRTAPAEPTSRSVVRRLVRLLLVDAAILALLVAGTALGLEPASQFVRDATGVGAGVASAIVVSGAAALAAPFCLGVVRVARKLGTTLAGVAMPLPPAGRADNAAAPRRALVVTVQLAGVLLVAVPVLALTQPFVDGSIAAAMLAVLLVVLGIAFWRSATDLQGHVRAGAEVIVAALVQQSRDGGAQRRPPTLEPMRTLLPGLGAPTPVEVCAGSPCVGRTLADLDLRGRTGATVLAVTRDGEGVIVPTAKEALRQGDVLALAGTSEAVDAATELLLGPRTA